MFCTEVNVTCPAVSTTFTVDGQQVTVEGDQLSLLEALRDQLGRRGPKDGCSPQGQCGCCTVLVDGQPRVACVTPVSRVAGRAVTTIDGLTDADEWAAAFCAAGASQCGFCTPGIITRLSVLSPDRRSDRRAVDQALLAHLCRCTGWQTIHEACAQMGSAPAPRVTEPAEQRAELEGGVPQQVNPAVSLGRGRFSDDTCPTDALVAVLDEDGTWHVGESLTLARQRAGRVQGRRTTAPLRWPIEVPAGRWSRVLRTTWVEPAYLEPDVAWCEPGGQPSSPLANGGAFGGKTDSIVQAAARTLADEHGRTVRAVFTREDCVRFGPKRPPFAGGVDATGAGIVRVVATPGIAEAIVAMAPRLDVELVEVAGPPTSASIRGAGWMEAAVLVAAATEATEIVSPGGGRASAEISGDGRVRVHVSAGDPLDAVVLRSYCIGAAHQALGWVRSEGVSVDEAGQVHDLTIRSFGILRAQDTPAIEIDIEPGTSPAVNGSDAVMAAVALAAWRAGDFAPAWPLARR